MRGENWPMASCTTTIVIVRTSAASETIEAATVDRIATAASGPPVSDSGTSSKSWALSIPIVPNDRTAPNRTQTTGTNHRLDRMWRRSRCIRMSGLYPDVGGPNNSFAAGKRCSARYVVD